MNTAAWPAATIPSASVARRRRISEGDDTMKGLIMDYPLTLTHFFERTRKLFHRKMLGTRVPGAGLQKYTYADYCDRVARLAGALKKLGLDKGDRVGTF